MSVTNSPNMGLIIPTVGSEPGPDYADDINASLTLVDLHDHSPGKGVQITPAGLNINDDLDFNGNFAIDVAGVELEAQSSTPDIFTVYANGLDLYYVDGLGNNIRMTQSGGVAGTPGSIANLVPPATATYVSGSKTFVWQSGVSIAANMDAASLLMRNITPNSTFALTLQPPAALSQNYSITLPALPGVNSFMQISSLGVISNTIPISHGLTDDNIEVGTQIPLPIQTVTTTDTVSLTSGIVLCDSAGGAYTVTLYTAVGHSGRVVRLKKTTSDFSVITVSGTSLTTTLNTIGEEIEVYSDGSAWVVLQRVIPDAWTSYTPTIGAGFGTPSNVAFYYRRSGSVLEVRGSLTTGTVAAALSAISVPSGLALDTGVIGITNTTGNAGTLVGDFSCTGAAGASGRICTATSTSTTDVYNGSSFSAANPLTPGAGLGSVTLASGSVYSARFAVPISGWN